MKNRKLVVFGVAGAVLSGLGAWAGLKGERAAEYRTAALDRGNIESTISATGNLNAVITVQVGSQVSGNIKALFATFNSQVKKGQLVARIDPDMFQARVNQAQANLDAANAGVANARANLEKADAQISNAKAQLAIAKANLAKEKVNLGNSKINWGRQSKLFDQGLISTADRDTAQATYDAEVAAVDSSQAQVQAASDSVNAAQADRDVAQTQLLNAQAQVKQQKAALQQAQIDLDHTAIIAPVDGTVVSRQVDVGQTVAASLQAPTLFQIAQDLTKMQVDTNVDEADVGRVQVGQQALFTVDAFPGRTFRGAVAEIRKAPINVQNVVTYDVVIAVANPDLKLFPGMTANVRVLVDRRDDVLRVPNAALRFRPAGAKTQSAQGQRGFGSRRPDASMQTVWTPGSDGKPAAAPVKLGVSDGVYTEIVSGKLNAGDRVIVAAATGTAQTQQTGQPFRRGPGF